MARRINSSLPAAPNRVAVRLLFAGFLVLAPALMLVRACFSEPYPGPFMPAFRGTGLVMSSLTEATIILPKMTVGFTDRTTAEITQPMLFADALSSIRRNLLFRVVPEPDLAAAPVPQSTIRRLLAHFFPEYHVSKPVTPVRIPGDVHEYLRRRLERIYPSKTPVRLTIFLYRVTFPLSDFHQTTRQLLSQTAISFP
jgi:hypothetical protein